MEIKIMKNFIEKNSMTILSIALWAMNWFIFGYYFLPAFLKTLGQ